VDEETHFTLSPRSAVVLLELRGQKRFELREGSVSAEVAKQRDGPMIWLTDDAEAQVLGKQLLRSGTSVGANYREAHRARSRAEFAAKCGDSLREIEESAYWLELLEESGIVPATKLQDLRTEANELTAIFVTIVMKSKK
jgi:four helix bundle protein